MHTCITIIGLLLFAVGAFVGVTLATTIIYYLATDVDIWSSGILIGLGIAIAIAGLGIATMVHGVKRMSILGKRMLGTALIVPAGCFLLWAGAGLLGLLYNFDSSVTNLFDEFPATILGLPLLVLGIFTTAVGAHIPFARREAIAATTAF